MKLTPMSKRNKVEITMPKDRRIAWKPYGKASFYSDNFRNKSGKPEFKISAITGTKFSCMHNNEEVRTAPDVLTAVHYFEGLVANRLSSKRGGSENLKGLVGVSA